MDWFGILAQTTAAATAEAQETTQIVPIESIWQQIISLSWPQAIIAISFGAVYLLYGWRIFKVLAVICFALLGLRLGIWAGVQFDNAILGGLLGLIILAILAIPLMRWAVCILGAVAGGMLAAGIWYAFELPEQYILAGGGIGIVAGGMISFIVFKISVMLFTSLGGSALMIVGMLSLLYHYETNLAEPTNRISELVHMENWFLPVLLMIGTIVGVIVQNNMIKSSPKWEL